MGLRVRITSDDTGKVVTICDSPDPLPSFGFAINGKRLVREQDLFRADYVKIFDQKNRVNRVSFEVTRDTDTSDKVFGGFAPALAWAMDHTGDCPVVGLVEFNMSDGGATISRYMVGGAVESVDLVKYNGPTLRLRYGILGGKFESTPPKKVKA